MVINSCSVVVGDGQTAFLVNEVADERGVKYETLWTDFVTSHAFCERANFLCGECSVPDADFGYEAVAIKANNSINKSAADN